jgi:serine/threonine protein kinase/outer membrane protein assembly factor BamB
MDTVYTRRRLLQQSISVTGLSTIASSASSASNLDGSETDVRVFGADLQNTGVYDSNPIREKPGIAWVYETQERLNSAPVITDGHVFVGSDAQNLHVIDVETGDGRRIYESDFSPHENHISSSPAVIDDTVYVAFGDSLQSQRGGEIVAIDTNSFETRWTFETDSTFSTSPVPAGSTVYVGGQGEGFYALDAATGELIWNATSNGIDRTVPAMSDNDLFIAGLHDLGTLSRVNPATQEREWDSGGMGGTIRSSPAVKDGMVYVGSTNHFLYAFDATSGQKQWEYKTDDWVTCSPSVAHGTVYVGTRGNTLHAVDATTGERKWFFQSRFWITGKPAIVDDLIYVGSWDNTITALTPTGSEQWSIKLSGDLRAGVVPVGNRIYIPSNGGNLYAVSQNIKSKTPSPSAGSNGSKPTTPSPSAESNGSKPTTDQVIGGATVITSLLAGVGLWRYRASTSKTSSIDGTDEDADAATDVIKPTNSGEQSAGPTASLNASSSPSQRAESAGVTTAETLAAVPEQIPTFPSLELDYDELNEQKRIGSGGKATVVQATVQRDASEIPLAIKKPRMSGTVHTDDVRALLQEANTWDSLDDHDHIVAVVDYDSRPLPWIALEYMDGGHLGDRGSEFSMEQAIWTAFAITRAVCHAHRQGVAHLDLKPENILFRKVDGSWDVPKIADWGLSKHLLDHSTSVDGFSTQYAAPEQFDTDYGPTDEQTDIYQLGAVFYELFTGRQPFEGTDTTVMRKVLTEQPTPPSEENPELPVELETILQTAMAKDKSERYESMLYLRDHLAQLLQLDSDAIGSVNFEGTSRPHQSTSAAEANASAQRESDASRHSSSTSRSKSHRPTASDTVASDRPVPQTDLSYDDIEVGSHIGRGNTSTVYRARIETDTGPRPAALKEIQVDETVHTEFIDAFCSGAENWQKIDGHAGIVDVIGWGTQPSPWLALEYMDRGDLGSVSDQLSPRQTAIAGIRIAESVHHAHSRGIAHLSLTPSNVLLHSGESDTVVKVSDWEISHLSLTRSESSGDLSLAYAAPEQLSGEYGEPNQATDVYALGAICYELFTGRPLVTGAPGEMLHATLDGAYDPATTVDKTLPSAVDNVLDTAMATEPSDRFESILYFRDALQDLL